MQSSPPGNQGTLKGTWSVESISPCHSTRLPTFRTFTLSRRYLMAVNSLAVSALCRKTHNSWWLWPAEREGEDEQDYMLCVNVCGFLFLSAFTSVADGAFLSSSESEHAHSRLFFFFVSESSAQCNLQKWQSLQPLGLNFSLCTQGSNCSDSKYEEAG